MNVDPRLLSQLSIIVETGSFQSAADQLALTQPALSRNMKVLEERVGAKLFRREGRRSVPNNLGMKMARSGRTIRMAEEQAFQIIDEARRGNSGELRIGAPPIVAGLFLTNALSTFLTQNPSCTVELRTGLLSELRLLLERGQINKVIGPQSVADPAVGLEFELLVDDRVGILCSTEHSLARKRRIQSADLQQQLWVAHSKGSMLRQQTEAAMFASGVTHMQIAIETDSIRSVLEIVADTQLITTMPRVTTQPYLQKNLKFLPFDHAQFKRPIGVIGRRDTPTTGVEDRFLALLRSSTNTI